MGIFLGTMLHLTGIKLFVDVNFDEEKAMRFSLERELQFHVYEDILAPKEEPQNVVEKPKQRSRV